MKLAIISSIAFLGVLVALTSSALNNLERYDLWLYRFVPFMCSYRRLQKAVLLWTFNIVPRLPNVDDYFLEKGEKGFRELERLLRKNEIYRKNYSLHKNPIVRLELRKNINNNREFLLANIGGKDYLIICENPKKIIKEMAYKSIKWKLEVSRIIMACLIAALTVLAIFVD